MSLQRTKGPIDFDTQICPMKASLKAVTKNVSMETLIDVDVENQSYKS